MIICLGTTPSLQRVMVFKKLAISGVNRTANVLESLAGKSVNVAKVLADLGVECTATGFAGGDRGDELLAGLSQRGIAHNFVRVKPRTRLCVTIIDEGDGQHTELVEESREVEPEAWHQLRATLGGLLSGASVLALSGTLTPGAPADFYAECVRRAHEAGVPAIVDAQGAPLLRAIEARPAVIKPNRAEMATTLGMCVQTEQDVRTGMKRLAELGATRVVVTMGGEGALAADGHIVYRVRIPTVNVINSIGSGDACCAGLAAGMSRGEPFVESLRLGMACGTANAMTLLAGNVRKEDVEELVSRVRIDEI